MTVNACTMTQILASKAGNVEGPAYTAQTAASYKQEGGYKRALMGWLNAKPWRRIGHQSNMIQCSMVV